MVRFGQVQPSLVVSGGFGMLHLGWPALSLCCVGALVYAFSYQVLAVVLQWLLKKYAGYTTSVERFVLRIWSSSLISVQDVELKNPVFPSGDQYSSPWCMKLGDLSVQVNRGSLVDALRGRATDVDVTRYCTATCLPRCSPGDRIATAHTRISTSADHSISFPLTPRTCAAALSCLTSS